MTPGRQVGGYTLLERLGQGGMGEVWLAEDRTGAAGGAPRRVALKLLSRAMVADPAARARFAREVQAARRVRGPTVAALLDADVGGDEPWLASAYVAGPTLQDHVTTHGPLPDRALQALGVALAEALATIHGAGVVHRDLTPRNVVLGPDGPRVVDFGIAWFEGAQQVTATGEWIGTPSYMAPERLISDEITPAGDVWSWGAVMAFAAQGRPAVRAGSADAATDRIVRGDLDLVDLPEWLAPWVAAALAVDADQRPDVERLVAGMAGTDVTAPVPPSPPTPATTRRDDRSSQRAPRSRTSTRRYPPGPLDPAGGTYPSGEDPARRRRRQRWMSALATLLGAAVVGWLVPLLVAVMITAVVLLLAVGLRLARENVPDEARPVPPTWAVALAGPLVLGVGLAQVVGATWAVAILLVLVGVFIALGGDIG